MTSPIDSSKYDKLIAGRNEIPEEVATAARVIDVSIVQKRLCESVLRMLDMSLVNEAVLAIRDVLSKTDIPFSAVLNTQTKEALINDNTIIDFPDVDQMPMKTMLYIQPNWANYEALTTESDNSLFNIAVFIVCKKDKQENLTRKVYGYFNALYSLLRTNWSLDGEADFTEITDADFYPAVEGNRNVQAIEVFLLVSDV